MDVSFPDVFAGAPARLASEVETPKDRPRGAGQPVPGLPTVDSFDIGAFELARTFVDHLVAQQAAGAGRVPSSTSGTIDWEALTRSVGDASSLEMAIGRAVASADRLLRETPGQDQVIETGPPSTTEAPFFAFTQADAVPDFGDESVRSRLVRKVSGIVGKRRAAATVTKSGLRPPSFTTGKQSVFSLLER